MPQSQPAPGKAFYEIFPTPSTNHGETASFVRGVVDTDELWPLKDEDGNLVSWTVAIDGAKLNQLKNHPEIERVIESEPQGVTVQAELPDSGVTPERTSVKRQDTLQSWLIFPTDGVNTTQVAETEQFLQTTSGNDPTANMFGNELSFWEIRMTQAQRDEVVKNSAVSSAVIDEEIFESSVAEPRPNHASVDDSWDYPHIKR